jgi:uncharacterized membrane protein
MKNFSTKSFSFETVFSLVLLAPILFFFFGNFLGSSIGFLFSFISLLLIPLLLLQTEVNTKRFKALISRSEIESFTFFACSFAVCLWFCLSWPDFIAIGERLRDYALLGALQATPLQANESWMVGENLNYYLYWYRFAAFWSSIFSLETWQSYHLLSAFTYAFFLSSIFRLCRVHLNCSLSFSTLSSLLIGFGSNIAGIISAYSADHNWWGPSRVIKGTINEFPVWSFLLGDLHPHYCNLALTPFVLCLAIAMFKTNYHHATKLILACACFSLAAPLYYNSNAWEVPMAGITFSIILGLALLPNLRSNLIQFRPGLKDFYADLKDYRVVLILALIFLSIVSLVLSSANIQPADYPWRLVADPVPASSFLELLQHWGLPLALIIISILVKIENAKAITLLFGFCFALALALQSTALSFIFLAAILASIAYLKIQSDKEIAGKVINSVVFGLGISSLILIALGEMIYLDDPYGGENERMNTVFKIYSATWAPLHLFAFIFAYQNLRFKKALTCLAVATLPAFFLMTTDLRKNSNPSMEGLASLEQEHNGASDAVRFLRSLERSIVLEAQGNPYSYTSFMCTLGGHDCYLGWANHVGLLTGKHDEVSRREKITAKIYSSFDCEKKKELALQEKIKLIAIGHIESEKYSQESLNVFDCMELVYSKNGYRIYRP